jgi:hypothetical protein
MRLSVAPNSTGFQPVVVLMLVLLGAMVLLNNLGKPRVEALHGSDVGDSSLPAYVWGSASLA